MRRVFSSGAAKTPGPRRAAQQRADRIRAFRDELDALAGEGLDLLTPEQRESIRRHHDAILKTLVETHDVDRSDAAGRLSRGMRVASFFAALTLTAALYSLVLHFWGRIDLPLQAALLCLFPLTALVGVELAAQRERTLYVASVFALVAYGTYWIAVGTLGHLLSVPVTPAALWGGALFGAALALPYGFRLVFGGALVALLVAFSGSVFEAAGVPWPAALEYLDIITIAAFVLAVAAPQFGMVNPGFAPVARLVGFGLALSGVLLMAENGQLSVLTRSSRVSAYIYQGVMLVGGTILLALAVRRQWREIVPLATAALTIFLLLRCIDWLWDRVPGYVFFLVLSGIAFTWLALLRRVRARMGRMEEQ